MESPPETTEPRGTFKHKVTVKNTQVESLNKRHTSRDRRIAERNKTREEHTHQASRRSCKKRTSSSDNLNNREKKFAYKICPS